MSILVTLYQFSDCMHKLSKSTYMGGLQCLKKLYLNQHHRELKTLVDEAQQFIFDQGSRTGELAQQVFPGGEDCTPKSFYDFRPSIERTQELIQSSFSVIYEAAFLHEGVLAALDVLVLKEDGWHAYEVKSTNSTKSEHIQDAALQYWVITQSGLALESMNLMHFNKEYVKMGQIVPSELFVADNITVKVQDLQTEIPERIDKFKSTLLMDEIPDVPIGSHCTKPYTCDFQNHCWRKIPEYSVLDLTNGRQKSWDLFHSGVVGIKDVPEDTKLSRPQSIQVHAEKTGESIVDDAGIRDFLNQLSYPLYYFDFESIMPGVPAFDRARPYQQICFQYSLHVQMERGEEPAHFEFLGNPEEGVPRIPMLEQMRMELGTEGSILVYHKSFEDGRLKEMMRDCSGFDSDIQN